MQEQMMVRLNCATWDDVQRDYPKSSSQDALKFHFLAFKNIKTRANPRSTTFPCPVSFLAHLDVARQEKERKDALDVLIPSDESLQTFTSAAFPLRTCYYSVITGDVKDILSSAPKRDYSLAIADIPYGYRLKGSVNDEVAYTYLQINAMVQNVKQLTTANIWRIVVFHSTNQAAAVAKAFKDNLHGYEVAAWHKPNLKRALGARLISSFELFSIGYFSAVDKCRVPMHCSGSNVSNLFDFPAVTRKLRHQSAAKDIVNPYQKPQRLMNEIIELFSHENDWILDLFSGSGTTTVCGLKKGRNIVAIEKDPLQGSFISQRVCAIDDLPDADQEVGAKFIEDNEKFGIASLEPQPPLQNELGGLAELEEESMERSPTHDAQKPASPVVQDVTVLDV